MRSIRLGRGVDLRSGAYSIQQTDQRLDAQSCVHKWDHLVRNIMHQEGRCGAAESCMHPASWYADRYATDVIHRRGRHCTKKHGDSSVPVDHQPDSDRLGLWNRWLSSIRLKLLQADSTSSFPFCTVLLLLPSSHSKCTR